MSRPLYIIGAGGHGKSVLGSLLRAGRAVTALVDADARLHGTSVLGVPVAGGDEVVLARDPAAVVLVNGVGSVGPACLRAAIHAFFTGRGYAFATVLDPTALIGHEVVVTEGAQVLAGAVVQAGTSLGAGAIVNSRAVVDHDCRIGAHAHVATGAVLAGHVEVGEQAMVGCGAAVRQGIRIGAGAVVGVGAAVVRDVAAGCVVAGTPARVLKRGN